MLYSIYRSSSDLLAIFPLSSFVYRSAINLCEHEIMRIGQFWRFLKTLCDFKLCDCIVRKILLTVNCARLKFVRNLIMQSGSDSHK